MKPLFTTLAAILAANSMVTIVIRKNEDGNLVASTNFNNNDVTDEAKKLIAPFIVSGSPEELDNEFAEVICAPLEQSKGLQTSMQEFEAQQKVAKANSQAAKTAKQTADSLKKQNETLVKSLMDKAKALQKDKKYSEAVNLYSKALALASGTTKAEIQKEIDTCKKNDTPDLFSFGDEEETVTINNTPADEPTDTPDESGKEPGEETPEDPTDDSDPDGNDADGIDPTSFDD